MKKFLSYTLVMFAAAIAFTSCNPLTLDEPLPLAADFTDPIYPKTYGRVSITVEVDPNAKPSENVSTKAGDMKVQFYFIVPGKSKAAPGTHVLCAEYARWSDMPAVTRFPEGDYLVVASSQASASGEYMIGKTDMRVNQDGAAIGNIMCELVAGDFSASHFPSTFGKMSFALTFSSQSPLFAKSEVTPPYLQDMPVRVLYVKTDGDTVLAKYYEKFSAIPPVALFPTGKYVVITASHNKLPEMCDYAVFSDTVRTEVVLNGAVTAEMDMKMRNAIFSLVQSPTLEVAFISWQANLFLNNGEKPALTFPSAAKTSFFIAPQPIRLSFAATQKADSKPYTQTFTYAEVKPDTKIEINLTGNTTGKGVVEISVNGKIVQNDHDIAFPDDDTELGGGGQQPNPDPNPKPDPDPDPDPVPTVPVVTGEGFDVDKVKTLSKTKDFDADGAFIGTLKVAVTAQEGVQQFVITIDSPDIGAELLVPLFGDTKFDLANVTAGSNLEKNLDQLGILPRGTKVKGENTFAFDLTAFMGLLPVNSQTHNFGLKVVDAKGQVVNKIVKILVVE